MAPALTTREDVVDQALALAQFDKLMSDRKVTPYYQPIVDLATEATIGYEVLGRSPLYGVRTPKAMFRAAAKLNQEVELSRMLRWQGIQHSAAFPQRPHLFVNTHPAELTTPGLAESMRSIRKANSRQPLTLEIHEAAVTDERVMAELRAVLNDLDISLAYDDFGSGRARLVELAAAPPDYLKFDISLIHHIDSASQRRQQMVSSLVNMVRDLGITSLAEGIETAEERQTCQDSGFNWPKVSTSLGPRRPAGFSKRSRTAGRISHAEAQWPQRKNHHTCSGIRAHLRYERPRRHGQPDQWRKAQVRPCRCVMF